MDTLAEDNNIETEEEAVAYRQQVVDDMAAEDGGRPTPVIVQPKTEQEINTKVLPAEPDPELVNEEETVDPWEGVNPALKEQFTAMSTRLENLGATELRLKQAESRIGAITNELHIAKEAAETAAANNGSSAPTQEQMANAAQSDEKWNNLKDDFPEWAEAIDSRLTSFKNELVASTSSGISQEEFNFKIKEIREENKDQTSKIVERAVLSYAHPNWEVVKKSSDYAAWLKIQTPEVVAKTKSPKAVDAISVLSMYKKSKPKSVDEIKTNRQSRLEASTAAPGRQGDAPTSEENMTDEEFRAQAAQDVFKKDS